MRQLSGLIPVKAFLGILYSNRELLDTALTQLSARYGTIDYASDIFPFAHSPYYEKEMGSPIYRQFITLAPLILPKDLVALKQFCTQLEHQHTHLGNRRINLDPGYVTTANVVLSSAKNYSHRIYLDAGVFAEVEFRFEKNQFTSLPWTYPEYTKHVEFFHEIRQHYKQQLKSQGLIETPSELRSFTNPQNFNLE